MPINWVVWRWMPSLSILLATMVHWSSTGHAGGYYTTDFGTRRGGMFTVIGYPDDLSGIFHNPAGMVLWSGTQFYHSQGWMIIDATMRMYDSQGVLHPLDGEVKPKWSLGVAPFLAMGSDFGTKRFRGGVALFAPNVFGASLPTNLPSRYHVHDALFIAPRLTLSAAYAVTPRFSIGMNLNAIGTFLTASRTMNVAVLANPDARFRPLEEMQPTDATLKMTGYGATWSLDLSTYFQPSETFRFGVVFMGGARGTLEGPVDLTYPDGSVESANQHTVLPIPFTLQAGSDWIVAEGFHWGVDVRFWHYQVNQMQETKLDGTIMGLSQLDQAKSYGNSWNVGTGLLYELRQGLDVMVGCDYDWSALPTNSISMEMPVSDRLSVSAGARWWVRPDLRLGLSVARLWLLIYDIQESYTIPPTNAKGWGAMSKVALDIMWQL